MAGLFGVVSLRRDARESAQELGAALDRLARALSVDSAAREQRWLSPEAGVAVGRAGRACLDMPDWPASVPSGRMFATGFPVTPAGDGPPGGFFSALTLRTDGVAVIETDRAGSRRIFFAVHAGRLWFAPEARAVAAVAGSAQRLDPAAVGMLLSSGVLYRGQTLFDGVRRLCGGERLVLGAGRMAREERRRFVPGAAAASRADRGALVEETARRILGAVARHMASVDETVLFLSGGSDSRAILAGMLALPGVAASRVSAVSWGDEPGRPDGDLAVAFALAGALGLRHRGILREEAGFAAKFERFNLAVGGASVMAAEHPDEPRIMAMLAAQGFRRSLRGDTCLLTRPAAYTLEQAWQGVGLRRPAAAPRVAALLAPRARARVLDAAETVFDDIAARYGSVSPQQAKEMLYFDVRLQGYLFDAAHVRLDFLDERNVLLDDDMLDLVEAIPDPLRPKAEVFEPAVARLTAGWPPAPLARSRNLLPWAEAIAPDRPAGAYCLAALADVESPVWDYVDREAALRLSGSGGAAAFLRGTVRRLRRSLDALDPRLSAAAAAAGRRMGVRELELLKRVVTLKHVCDWAAGRRPG